tara:strand:+ start:437 stop:1186 length:750 start_codon:yes stop_codon:yes gene_type:complete
MKEKLSGKTVLVNGELVPIENLLEGRETKQEREARHELVENEKAEREKQHPDLSHQMEASMREVKEAKRQKYIQLLRKHIIHFDGNLGHDAIFDLVKEHKLVDEEGKTTLKGAEEVEKKPQITSAEAKLRSSLQAKIMDEDIDVDLNAETEVLQGAWLKFVEESKDAKPVQEDTAEPQTDGNEPDDSEDDSELPSEGESKEEVKKRLQKEEKESLIAKIKEIGSDEKPTLAWGIPKLEKLLKKLETPAL